MASSLVALNNYMDDLPKQVFCWFLQAIFIQADFIDMGGPHRAEVAGYRFRVSLIIFRV